MDVHVHERALVCVVAEPVGASGNQPYRRRQGELEAETIERAIEPLGKRGIDQEIDVAGAALPVGPFIVTFPLAAAHPTEIERLAQPVQQRGRSR